MWNSRIRTPNVNAAERWGSVIGGSVLAIAGFKVGSARGKAMMTAGGLLILRGVTGRSQLYQLLGLRTASPGQGSNVSIPYELGFRVDAAITINKPRPELYAFWREFTNLPRFMRHLKEVQVRDGGRTHWVAEGPAGSQAEWDAEVIQETENQSIGWRSLTGSQIDTAGSVHFRDAPGGRGCEILVELQYNPPGGAAGVLLAKVFGRDPRTEIEEDLSRLKQQLEAGEIPTIEGQPHGAGHKKARSHPATGKRHGIPIGEAMHT